jgi:mannan endo-1,4-beta-mannosidase
MRPRFALLISLVLATVALAYAASHFVLPIGPPAVHTTLPRGPASYLGVFATGAPPAYEPVAEFAQAAHKQPNLVGYYSGWSESFKTPFAKMISSHGAIPYVQIDPTLASIPGIAEGKYDLYLRSYADSVREFGHSVVIGFGHEMNAPWVPWGSTNVSPATFIAAWRYVVTLFRSQGADNVTWLWTINADRPGTGPIASWWPGGRYVTWVGIDGYYALPSDTFANVFGQTIDQVKKFTRKPVLLSETAVGPRAGQFGKIGNLFNGMRQYKTLGLVWFDKAQSGSLYHQDWRIQDSANAETAFAFGVSALTLAHP